MTQQIHYVTFRSCTKAEYEASAKDEWSVYFITDTQEIYKGAQNYGSSAEGSSYTAGTGISILDNAIAISGASSATNGYILSKTAGGVAWISAPTGTVSSYAKQTTAITNLSVQPGVFYEWTVLAASQLSATNWSKTSYQESMLKIIKDASTITLNGIDFVKDETLTFTNAGTYYCKVYSWGGFLRLEIKEYRTVEESAIDDENLSMTYYSYDIDGIIITQYEENADLAKYVYNEDGLDLQVVQEGYVQISGKTIGTIGQTETAYLVIKEDGTLWMNDPLRDYYEGLEGIILISDLTTWTAVAGFAYASSSPETSYYAYAIKAGELYSINYNGTTVTITRIGELSHWSSIAGVSDGSIYYAIGICAGKLYSISGNTATQIGSSESWSSCTGVVKSENSDDIAIVGYGINAGNLYGISADSLGVITAELIDNSGTWTKVSGYSILYLYLYNNNGGCYGINNGSLYRISGLNATEIGVITGWTNVWMLVQDEGIGIRQE